MLSGWFDEEKYMLRYAYVQKLPNMTLAGFGYITAMTVSRDFELRIVVKWSEIWGSNSAVFWDVKLSSLTERY